MFVAECSWPKAIVVTGFVDLDEKTAGLQEGDLIIVAGRPSMGKTAFALNMAEHISVDNGLPVAIFSMEMGGTQLADAHAGLDLARRPAPHAHRPADRRGVGQALQRHGHRATIPTTRSSTTSSPA